MKFNTNHWNKVRYTLYAPWYDLVGRVFKQSRKRSIESLGVTSGDKVLIVGAGTGLDLEFLPDDCEIFATDITPSMVHRIRKRNVTLGRNVQALVMDGQALEFADHSFDRIIMHLVLAVIPDPIACIREAERVLKPGGIIVVFDKFVPGSGEVSLFRKAANVITSVLFSDITREFRAIVSKTQLTVLSDIPADFRGNFRLIKLTKK